MADTHQSSEYPPCTTVKKGVAYFRFLLKSMSVGITFVLSSVAILKPSHERRNPSQSNSAGYRVANPRKKYPAETKNIKPCRKFRGWCWHSNQITPAPS